MNILTLVLVIVSVVLAVVLTFVVYTIRKYLLAKKANDKEKKYGGSRGRRNNMLSSSTSTSSDLFQVPIITRPTMPQLPFQTFECTDGGRSESSQTSLYKKKRGVSSSVPDLTLTTPEKRISVASLPLEAKEERLTSVVTPVSMNRSRRISTVMISALKTQGKTVSEIDLRSASITNDMFLQAIYPNYNFSNDDVSSISGTTDIYDSPSVDLAKRRVGKSRPRRRNGSDSGLSAPIKRTYKKSGKITFTTRFIESEKIFEIHILRASDLAPKRDVAEINPFVRVYLQPGKKQKKQTKPLKATKEPFINEKILFTDIDDSTIDKYRLKLKVYNHGRLKKNELLGEMDIALSSIDMSAKETFNLDLFLQRSESSLASVCVSICHQATFNKLEVIVQEAKHLPRIAGLPNPYVAVQLFKDHDIERKETAQKRGTRDPVFKESLEFDITCDTSKPLCSFSLAVSINHHPIVGKDQVLGHVLFSLDSPQKTAQTHWQSVHDMPHKHIEFWHSLLDPDEL